MRPIGRFLLSLAVVICFAAVITVAALQSEQSVVGLNLSDAPDSLHLELSHEAPLLALAPVDAHAADRRESTSRCLTLPRLSQLPRALCDAAAVVSLLFSRVGWLSGNRAPSDDRLRLSRSLVIQHVRLQV